MEKNELKITHYIELKYRDTIKKKNYHTPLPPNPNSLRMHDGVQYLRIQTSYFFSQNEL